jgi:phosphatidylinositol-3-phosphatase
MGVRSCLAVLLALLCASATAAAAVHHPKPSHVVLIALENREFDEVVGDPEATFFNYLAQRGALAVDYFAVSHPSLPNYLALLAGSTFGIEENCTECTVAGPNLATQLSRAGVSWKAYMGGLPYPCYSGGNSGGYAKRHDPFAYFPTLTTVPRRCNRIVPETQLEADLERHRLPAFGWITPDVCNDAHDCPFGVADYYLSLLAPKLTRQLGPNGLLIVTFDEGLSDAGCCGPLGGGHVATIVIGPDVPHGVEIRRLASHYSLLAALEERFELPRLGLAGYSLSLSPALFRPRN